MGEMILHITKHTLLDTLKMLPFLFVAYLLIEFLEHKASERLQKMLSKSGHLGIVIGSLLGCLPQCGISVAAANFYSGRVITIGTLVAVFLATSDEAIPVLLSSPQHAGMIFWLILIKVVVALIAGFAVDLIGRLCQTEESKPQIHDHNLLCDHCGCEEDGVFRSAIKHTVTVLLFILAVNLGMNVLMETIGEQALSTLLLSGSIFQPFLAALIGLIPNCASSVMLVELYLAGGLQFGSAVAGLCTGAGVGLAVLFRTNRNWKQNLLVVGLLYGIGAGVGMILNLF